MKKRREIDRENKATVVFLTMLLLAWLGYSILSGFTTAGDVWVNDFAVSEDGGTMTVSAGVVSAAGFLRDCKAEQDGGKCYLRFYHAFGGVNGDIGAKSRFSFPLDENCTEIYVQGNYQADGPVCVLRKADDGTWAWALEPPYD